MTLAVAGAAVISIVTPQNLALAHPSPYLTHPRSHSLSLSALSRVSTTVLIHGLTSTTCVPAGAERTHALTHVGDAGQGVHVRHTPSSHKHWVHLVMTFPIRFFVDVSFCTDSSSRLVEQQLPGHFSVEFVLSGKRKN